MITSLVVKSIIAMVSLVMFLYAVALFVAYTHKPERADSSPVPPPALSKTPTPELGAILPLYSLTPGSRNVRSATPSSWATRLSPVSNNPDLYPIETLGILSFSYGCDSSTRNLLPLSEAVRRESVRRLYPTGIIAGSLPSLHLPPRIQCGERARHVTVEHHTRSSVALQQRVAPHNPAFDCRPVFHS